MKFFDAIQWMDKKADGFKVYGIDRLRNKQLLGTYPTLEAAKKVAQEVKFSGQFFDSEIIDPKGNPMQPAGVLSPKNSF